jgi:glycosyltransferase involved in cell wall biosynthesis
MTPTCAVVSFRLGGTDGVSIVAESWILALEALGFDVVTVAGEGPVDRSVTGLEIVAGDPPDRDAVATALADCDLVIVENLLTIPMNLPASMVVAEVLHGRPALLHHHDPPWQRDRYRDVDALPVDDPAWRHVTINQRTARELQARGIDATTIYNGFDVEPAPGDRQRTRQAFEIPSDEIVVMHPVRAIERKAIPVALELAEQLHATYWLTGPAEEGFDAALDRLLSKATTRTIHAPIADLDDLYAAADVIAFPSTWEGFGNPPIEASIRRRPVAIGTYSVLDEILDLGFAWLDVTDPASVGDFLASPDDEVLARNRAIARQHFSTERMTERIAAVLRDAGWLP